MAGESDTRPDELFKQTFFNQDKAENKLDKHGFERKLRSMLSSGDTKAQEVITYLNTLSPSGIELEFISLASVEFDSSKKMQDPNLMMLKMLDVLKSSI